mmetsp:Transcript_71310/g.87476  ORF Transcript_71310/g.87476 Transcript_71310/m.87476 type:complete len:316 (+) Transcript_71310:45-992(+)
MSVAWAKPKTSGDNPDLYQSLDTLGSDKGGDTFTRNPRNSTFIHVQEFASPFKEHKKELMEWAKSQENIDLYQLNAFYAGTHAKGNYLLNYVKTFAVLGIQLFGMSWIIVTKMDEVLNDHNCDSADFSDPSNWIAFFFSLYLALIIGVQLTKIGNLGMYSWSFIDENDKNDNTSLANMPPFINRLWLGIGLLINVLLLIVSFFVSILVVYTTSSGEPLDMALNSMAVYFITELDDEIVGPDDYANIERFLTSNEYETYMYRQWYNKETHEVTYYTLIGNIILKFSLFTNSRTFRYIIGLFCLVAPVYVLICFDKN